MVTIIIGLYVTQLTGSVSAVGLVLGAYTAPLVLFLLLGGVLADRLPRRAVMIGSDAVRGVLHAAVAVLIALDAAQVWHLVLVGLLFGTAAAFFRPAYTGLVPQSRARGAHPARAGPHRHLPRGVDRRGAGDRDGAGDRRGRGGGLRPGRG